MLQDFWILVTSNGTPTNEIANQQSLGIKKFKVN